MRSFFLVEPGKKFSWMLFCKTREMLFDSRIIPRGSMSMGPVIFKIFSTVDRFMAINRSGLISSPFSRNQRTVLALVGKLGSQLASRSLYQPWPKACWMGVGGLT